MIGADGRAELAAILERYDRGERLDEDAIAELAHAARVCLGLAPASVRTRLVDVRLVLDRHDRTRAYVERRPVLTFASAAEALSTLAACVEGAPAAEQLEALRAPERDEERQPAQAGRR